MILHHLICNLADLFPLGQIITVLLARFPDGSIMSSRCGAQANLTSNSLSKLGLYSIPENS